MNISKITNAVFDIADTLPKFAQKASYSVAQDIAEPKKITSTLDCLAANAIPAINKTNQKTVMPEFIYHITSKENYEKILKDGKMRISDFEANTNGGCKGIYFVDKDNFLNKWVSRKEVELLGDSPFDISELLMIWTCKGANDVVAIQVPTSKLQLSQLRFRPYIKVCEESLEKYNPDTAKIESKLVQEGLPISDLSKFANTDEPIEYVYTGEITSDMFSGFKLTKFSENMKEMIHNLFGCEK